MSARARRGTAWSMLVALGACGGPQDDPFAKKDLDVPRRVAGEDLDAHRARLRSPWPGERASAFWALSDLGTADAELRAAFPDALEDPSSELRLAALHALARRGLGEGEDGAPLVPAVLRALDADEAGLRAAAREALRALGASGIDALVERLDAADVRARWNAVAALERIGAPASVARSAVEAAFVREADGGVRDRLAGVLARCGEEGVRTLLATLRAGDAERSGSARDALERAPAVPLASALRAAFAERGASDESLRDTLASLAARRTDLARALVPELVALLGDEGPAAYDAEDALLGVGDEARSALRQASGGRDGAAAAAARALLDRIESPDEAD